MYQMKEKNHYSECYKKVLYAGPKWDRNILTNLSPNPARPEKPDPKSPARITTLQQIEPVQQFNKLSVKVLHTT